MGSVNIFFSAATAAKTLKSYYVYNAVQLNGQKMTTMHTPPFFVLCLLHSFSITLEF